MDGVHTHETIIGDDNDINRSALTLIELLIAIAVGIWLLFISATLYVVCQRTWHGAAATLELARKANLGMERIMRGFRSAADAAPRGLLDADAFVIVNSYTIRFTSGMDLRERSFYLSAARLMYDPDTSIASDEMQILDDVSGLDFSASALNPTRLVVISLSLTKKVQGVDKTFTLPGKAFIRND